MDLFTYLSCCFAKYGVVVSPNNLVNYVLRGLILFVMICRRSNCNRFLCALDWGSDNV